MDPDWLEFRAAPRAYLTAHRTSADDFAEGILQIVTSDGTNDQTKLAALSTLQEMGTVLFSEAASLEMALSYLRGTFQRLRANGSSLVASQVLCATTTLLISMEHLLGASHRQLLADFLVLLFDVVERVKTDSNRLLRCMACECLRELEMTYPGMLSDKVGHFYGMSLAETTHIHQSYMALFATVLDNTLKKVAAEQRQEGADVEHSLSEVLSHSDQLKNFTLPADYQDVQILMQTPPLLPPSHLRDESSVHEVKKGVSFVLDHSSLFTPSTLSHITLKLISCVQYGGLAPKMLKYFLLQYLPCLDLQLFHLVLLLRVRFGELICDEGDEEALKRWLSVFSHHPALPAHRRALLLQWLVDWKAHAAIVEGGEEEDEEDRLVGPGGRDGEEEEAEVNYSNLLPSVFDSPEICCYKIVLYQRHLNAHIDDVPPPSLTELLSHSILPMRVGVAGGPAFSLYRTLFVLYTSAAHVWANDIRSLLVEIIQEWPLFIPPTIDFISSVQRLDQKSSLPVSLLAEFSQYLAESEPSSLLEHLSLHLALLRQAALYPQINPVILLKILKTLLKRSSLCRHGDWELGTSVLAVCNTLMRKHPTETVFKELAHLLLLLAQEFDDLDVRDRATFYHQLLLTVSGEKLTAILDSDVTAGSSLSEIIEARISNGTFASTTAIHTIKEHFLTLSKIDVSVCHSQLSQGAESGSDSSLKAYLQGLDSLKEKSVTLPFRITFSSRPEGVSRRIYAIVLQLTTASPYHPCPDVQVPYLSFKGSSTDQTTPTSVSSQVISITLRPQQPVPAVFNVSVVFATEDGVTCSTELDPLRVEFFDLFQPPPSLAGIQLSPLRLFALLRRYIEDIQWTQSPREKMGALSTLHIDGHDWQKRVEKIRGLQISQTESTSKQKFLIFLPPCYHVLLSYNQELGSVLVAVDNWRLLPLVGSFLQGSLD